MTLKTTVIPKVKQNILLPVLNVTTNLIKSKPFKWFTTSSFLLPLTFSGFIFTSSVAYSYKSELAELSLAHSATVQSLQASQIENDQLSLSVFDLNAALHQLTESEKSLTTQLEDSNDQLSILGDEVDHLNDHVEELESKNASLEKENDRLNKTISSASNEATSSTTDSSSSWDTFTATYYDANEISTGKTPGHPAYGITKSGEPVKEGETVAVDPNVIPLGSWVEVKYPDGSIEKRKATDTGSAIKGRKIDIYIASASYTSGKHPVQVRQVN